MIDWLIMMYGCLYTQMTDWYWMIDDGINITVRSMGLIDDGTNNMKWTPIFDWWMFDDGINGMNAINAMNSIIRRIHIRHMKLNDDGIV